MISNEGAESLSRPAVAAELAGIQLTASLCRLAGRLLYGTKGFPHIPRHPLTLSDEPCGGLDFTGLHWVQ